MIAFDHRILPLFACNLIDLLDIYRLCTALHTSVFLYQYHGNSLFRIKNRHVCYIAKIENKNAVFLFRIDNFFAIMKINHVVSVFAQELKAQLAPPKSKTISVPIQVAKSISQSLEKVEHKSKLFASTLHIIQLFYDLSLVANTCFTFFILNQKPLKVACALG